ncbi:coiled-coil domain-containing protein 42 homolog [Ctenocephalides felis]|uniref:coiled-coil domain-containing protein 42 homolog n=1 Tax=Ctenocephalides felis TaxID=7515 RepID=UPI000E6E44D8|nr:coiled-coil domain-containing protein 42 homolog [Ctenocephalides felis]
MANLDSGKNEESGKNDKKIVGKPVKPPGLLVPFDCRPQIALEEYIMAKQTAKISYRFPEKDVARSGPGMALVLVNRELEEAQRHLENVRRFAAKEHKKINNKLREIQEIDLQVRHNALRYNKLVIENRDKRERSAKVLFLKNVAMLRNTRYQTPMDILNHYESIMMCKDRIYNEQQSELKNLNGTIDEVRKLEIDIAPEVVKHNVIMHDLRETYEKAKKTTSYWETKIERIKEVIHTSNLDLSQIQGACWQMYRFLSKHRGEKLKLPKDNTCDQLVYIKRGVQELKLIVEEAKRIEQLEEVSGKATVGSDLTTEIV